MARAPDEGRTRTKTHTHTVGQSNQRRATLGGSLVRGPFMSLDGAAWHSVKWVKRAILRAREHENTTLEQQGDSRRPYVRPPVHSRRFCAVVL